MLTLKNVTVVDSGGTTRADVVIEGEEITQVGNASADPETEIDLEGKFLTPGIIDCHVHLNSDGRPDPPWGEEGEAMLAYRATKNLEALLDAGVTTVRDLGTVGRVALDARDAVEEGVVPGPRVLAAGNNLTMTGGHGYYASGHEVDGREGIRREVRRQLKRGADVIKCMVTGGVSSKDAEVSGIELQPDEIEMLVQTANASNTPTAAHAHGLEGIKNAVHAGITSVEHGTFMDREIAKEMAERRTYWVPTAMARYSTLQHIDDDRLPDYIAERQKELEDEFLSSFTYAIEEDIPVAMGTDAGTAFNYHGNNTKELVLMVKYGFSEEEALRAATVNAADLLGLSDTGLVAEGYRADLLVLESNPLEDATAWQNPLHVFKAGQQVR